MPTFVVVASALQGVEDSAEAQEVSGRLGREEVSHQQRHPELRVFGPRYNYLA